MTRKEPDILAELVPTERMARMLRRHAATAIEDGDGDTARHYQSRERAVRERVRDLGSELAAAIRLRLRSSSRQ